MEFRQTWSSDVDKLFWKEDRQTMNAIKRKAESHFNALRYGERNGMPLKFSGTMTNVLRLCLSFFLAQEESVRCAPPGHTKDRSRLSATRDESSYQKMALVSRQQWNAALKSARSLLVEGKSLRSGTVTPSPSPTKRPASAVASSSRSTPTQSGSRKRARLTIDAPDSMVRSAELDAVNVTPSKTRSAAASSSKLSSPSKSTPTKAMLNKSTPKSKAAKGKAKETAESIAAHAAAHLVVVEIEEAARRADDRMVLDEAEAEETRDRQVVRTQLWDYELDPEYRRREEAASYPAWEAEMLGRMQAIADARMQVDGDEG
jgi:hypothetical protein